MPIDEHVYRDELDDDQAYEAEVDAAWEDAWTIKELAQELTALQREVASLKSQPELTFDGRLAAQEKRTDRLKGQVRDLVAKVADLQAGVWPDDDPRPEYLTEGDFYIDVEVFDYVVRRVDGGRARITVVKRDS